MPVAGGGRVPAAEGEMRRLKGRGKMSCAGEEQPHSPANVNSCWPWWQPTEVNQFLSAWRCNQRELINSHRPNLSLKLA